MSSPQDTFVSKRDGWLVAVIWGSVALALAAIVPAFCVARGMLLARIALLGGLAAIGLGPWVLYTTAYVFERDALAIRSGPFRWRVRFAEIQAVEASANPLSSPACSLDRLLLLYGAKRILISPADRTRFLSRLAALCPHLHLAGERLLSPR